MGVLIFSLGVLHTGCHLINLGLNIQPDPVKFLQLGYRYWESHWGAGQVFPQYNPPNHCWVADFDEVDSCPDESLSIPEGVSEDILFNGGNFTCQLCEPGHGGWSYAEWLLTAKPGLFGLQGRAGNKQLQCFHNYGEG